MTDPSFRPKARRPRGLLDRAGAGLAQQRAMIARIGAAFEQWGFEPLDTAALEYADALGKFLPDQDRPNEGVFSFQDDDEQWLSLRYDLTAPLARHVAEHFDALPKPYRRWAAGPVWRNEKPGPGRYREFWQCDADTVGAPGAAADAEMIAALAAGLEAAGLARDQFVIKINTRRLLNAALEGAGVAVEDAGRRLAVLRAIDKLDRLGVDGVRALLGAGRKDESGDFTAGAGLAAGAIDRVLGFVQAGRDTRADTLAALAAATPTGAERDAGLAELEAIARALNALGVPDRAAVFDPAIVRGLEYYTGPVFEAEHVAIPPGPDGEASPRFGSIGSGGRYDGLVSRFRGEPIPATGCSIGVSRLAAVLASADAAPERAAGPVVVLALDQAEIADSLRMAQELRAAGVRAEAYLGGAGMKAQLRYADKRNSPVAVIVGSDERAKGAVTLKDLRLGAELAKDIADNAAWRQGRPAQIEAPRAELVAAVRTLLDRRP